MTKKILISVPNTGNIHKMVCFATDSLLLDKRYNVTIIRPTHTPYENSLHLILNDFMDGDFDFWLNIDSDNPPVRSPLDLITYDLDIIGLPTPILHFANKEKGERPWYESAYKYVPKEKAYTEWPTKDGLQRVDAVGTGCILFSRRVFENKNMRKAPFQRTYRRDGVVEYGNDIAFCRRAKKQGFSIFTHYGYRCQHFNEVEIFEMAKAFHDLYNTGDDNGK
jgi:hypothetical protein